MNDLIDIAGQRFGKLVAIELAPIVKGKKRRWLCKCDCGKMSLCLSYGLRVGQTRSCGCVALWRKRTPLVQLICPHCGQLYLRKPDQVKYKLKHGRKMYCCRDCAFAARSTTVGWNPNPRGNYTAICDTPQATQHEKDSAGSIVRRLVRQGRIIRPDKCERCGADCSPVGHHEDYKEPKEVIWLCYSCHRHRHWKRRA